MVANIFAELVRSLTEHAFIAAAITLVPFIFRFFLQVALLQKEVRDVRRSSKVIRALRDTLEDESGKPKKNGLSATFGQILAAQRQQLSKLPPDADMNHRGSHDE